VILEYSLTQCFDSFAICLSISASICLEILELVYLVYSTTIGCLSSSVMLDPATINFIYVILTISSKDFAIS